MKTIFAAAIAAASLTAAGAASATELLANGNFDGGNTVFYSAYTYAQHNAAGDNLWPEATYDVTTDPRLDHPSFTSFADHTPGTDGGMMMVINGSPTPDAIIWSEGLIGNGVSLMGAANTAYTFSFWLASVYPTSPANLQLWLNGVKVEGATFAATTDQGVWQQFSYSGVTGAAGLQSMSLSNKNLAPFGNDFALDDMSLQSRIAAAVPEPTTWALMILGFGAVGSALRANRRRMVPALAKVRA